MCPTFILHGIKDTLVSFTHSQALCDACGGPSFLLLPEEMDHNNLDIIADFIAPLSEFFENFSINTHNSEAYKSHSAHPTAPDVPDLSKMEHYRINLEEMEDVDECSMMFERDGHSDSLVDGYSNGDEEGEVPMDNCDYMVGYQYQ